MISDAQGNLYGTTIGGGAYGEGTVFEIAAGTHAETILYSFGSTGSTGDVAVFPQGSLISDAQGNLYGTAGGGTYGYGTVYEIAAGTHAETVLYSFGATSTDGRDPIGNLIFDAAGNLYGSTAYGGAYGPALSGGTVFEIAAGTHSETTLNSFESTFF